MTELGTINIEGITYTVVRQTKARSPQGVPVELLHDPGSKKPWVIYCAQHYTLGTPTTRKRSAEEFLREADLWCPDCHRVSYGRDLAR